MNCRRTLLSLLLYFLAEASAAAAQARPVLRVGVLLPLTGQFASWGTHMRRGAELAWAQLPAEQRAIIALSFEDDQFEGAKSVTAFKSLVELKRIELAITFSAQCCRAVVPVAERFGVPTINMTVDRGCVENTQLAMRHMVDAEAQIKVLGPLLQQRGIKRAAVVAATHDAMLDYARTFKERAGEYALEVVFNQDYPKSETDFRTAIEAIRRTKPEAIINVLLPGSMSSFMKQLRVSGVDAPVFGFAQAENPAEVAAADGAMEGLIYTASALAPEFVALYTKTYGEAPQVYSANSFDIVTMLGSLAQSTGANSREIARQLLALRDFPGVLGRYSAGPGRSFLLPAVLKIVRGGGFELQEKRRDPHDVEPNLINRRGRAGGG